MLSMLRSAGVMEDWRKSGNSPEQKTWTSAQQVCTQSNNQAKEQSGLTPYLRKKIT